MPLKEATPTLGGITLFGLVLHVTHYMINNSIHQIILVFNFQNLN